MIVMPTLFTPMYSFPLVLHPGHQEITSDIELLLIENQEYTCAHETIITIYVTALTKLGMFLAAFLIPEGYCHEVEVNLKNSLYNKLISIYTALLRQEAEKKQENANISFTSQSHNCVPS